MLDKPTKKDKVKKYKNNRNWGDVIINKLLSKPGLTISE